jgi:hypothetical protein
VSVTGLREPVGVEARLDGQRQHLAAVRVEDHGGRGERTPPPDSRPQHRLGVPLQRRVEGQADVTALDRRGRMDDVERAPEGIADDRLAAGVPGQRAVERQLQPGQPLVVHARIAEHVCGDRPLGIDAPLLRVEAEPFDPLPLERVGSLGVGLPGHVDEAARAVGQRPVQLVRIEPEGSTGRDRRRLRVRDVLRVRVHRRRPAADRELHAVAVDHRAAGRRHGDRRVMLALREAVEPLRVHGLEPDRSAEGASEGEGEEDEEEPDPPVRKAPAHRFARSR